MQAVASLIIAIAKIKNQNPSTTISSMTIGGTPTITTTMQIWRSNSSLRKKPTGMKSRHTRKRKWTEIDCHSTTTKLQLRTATRKKGEPGNLCLKRWIEEMVTTPIKSTLKKVKDWGDWIRLKLTSLALVEGRPITPQIRKPPTQINSRGLLKTETASLIRATSPIFIIATAWATAEIPTTTQRPAGKAITFPPSAKPTIRTRLTPILTTSGTDNKLRWCLTTTSRNEKQCLESQEQLKTDSWIGIKRSPRSYCISAGWPSTINKLSSSFSGTTKSTQSKLYFKKTILTQNSICCWTSLKMKATSSSAFTTITTPILPRCWSSRMAVSSFTPRWQKTTIK